MTSSEIRQSFLDFFKSKGHTIVPSSSLLPDAPNLLFTNAGMNQFVPIFLGQRSPDVDKWPGAIPGSPTRAADTQKCIRAGGKHNDLEDVGLDTYHHTFFEMLGNWSFGDYFKKEAIQWAWELVTEIWKFPKNRLYATVYSPDKSAGEPADFDQEAYDHWAALFKAAGLDPKIHIQFGGKKDNFWMMGDTGPCGPCSEIHVDLTRAGDTRGGLVNKGSAECIEIWNLVFIQFNANPDGSFSALPARHVDTGMGFERVTGIIQNTKNFTDFSRIVSNYETDIFRPIFDAIEHMSGKRYGSTLPGSAGVSPASVGVPPTESVVRDAQSDRRDPQSTYYKRRLPHFERPWAKYMVTFSTHGRRQLSPPARDIVLKSFLFGHEQRRYELYAACVMPDHAHFLFEPQIKEQDNEGKPVFWLLKELLHSIKSFTAHEINKVEGQAGQLWENESFDRMIRGDADLEEKFHYICRNPWDSGVVGATENYPWLWTPDVQGSAGVSPAEAVARDAQQRDRDGRAPHSAEQTQMDVAFRVIADHIRTLSFAISDGIQPGNTDRSYVLRRILRRAVRYGRVLGFSEPFFYRLVDVVDETMGGVFAEIRNRKQHVQQTIRTEEEAFNKTLDKGIDLFDRPHPLKTFILSTPAHPREDSPRFMYDAAWIDDWLFTYPQYMGDVLYLFKAVLRLPESDVERLREHRAHPTAGEIVASLRDQPANRSQWSEFLELLDRTVLGAKAFELYDTYGFPLDLTALIARERGMQVDVAGFEKLMQEQRERARKAQKKEVIEVSQIQSGTTKFVGYDQLSIKAKVVEVAKAKDKPAVVLDSSPAYAEMGGQVGDTGKLSRGGELWRIVNTQKSGNTWLHMLAEADAPEVGSEVEVSVDRDRRNAIQRHHSVTHLLHWALHEVVSKDSTQKGSYVGPEKLTFDFSSTPLTPDKLRDVEKLVNERIIENAGVSWVEMPFAEVKQRKDIMQFFGDKYGDTVRVVQIGGRAGELNGYSMELCGGTHTRATGEIGLFRITGESAIAAGIRRIEAVAGLQAYEKTKAEAELISNVAAKVNAPVGELEKKIESFLNQQKELEKQLKALQQKQAAELARGLVAKARDINGVRAIVENLGNADGDFLQNVADALKGQFKGVVVLAGAANNAVALVASVSPDLTSRVQAGKIIQTIAPIVGGKGGGRPDNARGGGRDASKIGEALVKAQIILADL